MASAGLADLDLTAAVRDAAGVDVAAVLVRRELPVDIRHRSKIDRAALAGWAGSTLAGRTGRSTSGMRVLVTGGRGLLGSAVVRELAIARARGHQHPAFDRGPRAGGP